MTGSLRTAESTALPHLEPLNRSRLIVVVGRSNRANRSSAIENILCDLKAEGYSVCRFDERSFSALASLQKEFVQFMSGQISPLRTRSKQYESISRKVIKLILLAKRPKLWMPLWYEVTDRKLFLVNSLERFLCQLNSPELYILAHSAGGIASSLVRSSDKVKKIVCFGYPFKHPERPEESYRTKHLETYEKPFLILQGVKDSYGSAEFSRRYKLSHKIYVVSVQADHDYDDFSSEEYERCLARLKAFFGN